jgi:4-hydroxy-2-oxoheptanedioate aldolase
MHMRPSRVLRKLRAGQVATCTKLNLAEPRAAEIAAQSGFDCIWLCNEHVPTDWSMLENMIRAAKVYDVDTLVRVSKGSYSDIVRPLEADAAGIMVPHLMSAEEARYIARTTRFHPVGRRPVDGGNADGAYTRVGMGRYLETANRERFVIVQIEDPEPLDELDEIASVEGIDMLLV